MHVSDIYVYVLIRLLNSLGRFGACRGCVECLQYIYIYILVLRLLNPRHLLDVCLCARGCIIEIHIYLYIFPLSFIYDLRGRDIYLSIHILALFYIIFSGVP